ncbi:MAG: iron only hydrogenase large subunit [Solidesulfovibrio magneticus str. Maddingley MBC34]|uniref:Iron only hydrogenase large subunit n=1 Tax=Solidesulfovibrio magneticus str. Maddingley MBC34 TaxID=1206767 RepID=K6G8J4_9BACT|nr:MAG: iron only hydrogenase large subunit [Solidesulfovibrio magneticus str. Maddingley MBC34]
MSARSVIAPAIAPVIAIDPNLCTGCRRCAEVCPVGAVSGLQGQPQAIDAERCVLCGQCVQVCCAFAAPFDEPGHDPAAIRRQRAVPETAGPVFAAHARCDLDAAKALTADPSRVAMVQCAPAVRVTLAEEFGLAPGSLTPGKLAAGLRRLGFAVVYDTTFAADVTVMEESAELLARIAEGGRLPLFTSCCPAWVRHVETAWPELIPHLSSCKSPQQMAGALFKSYAASLDGFDPAAVASVSVMPCTAKKHEAARPELRSGPADLPDVDAVVTVAELAAWLKEAGVDFAALPDEPFDAPLGRYSGAGVIFGAAGGVMEAALRTAVALCGEGRESANPQSGIVFSPAGPGVARAEFELAGRKLAAVTVSGLANVGPLLEAVAAGTADFQFMEVMCCPGGCVAGGGTPKLLPGVDVAAAIGARRQALCAHDRALPVRAAHANPAVTELYAAFLERPLSHLSHELLHTVYGGAAKGGHD